MTLYGIDISSAQAGIDAGSLPGDFVGIKATGGTSYLNPFCDQHYQQAKAAGKKVLVYHYAHELGCQGSATEEARWFIQNIRGYLGEAIPVLDWEGDNVTDSAYALEFKRVFEAEANVRLSVYGSTSQLEYLRPCHDADSPVWAAAYTLGYQQIDGYNPPQGPIGVPDGMTVSMWQFTSSGRLPGWGGNLDLNEFYGDAATWDKLAAFLDGTTPVPAPAAPAQPAPAPQGTAVAGQATIVSGDTLGGVANQVGVSLADLEAVNPGIDYDNISVGQIINLPAGANLAALGGAPAAPAAVSQCVVEAGDTLAGIAAQFGTSVDHLVAVNGIADPNLIYPGQVLSF